MKYRLWSIFFVTLIIWPLWLNVFSLCSRRKSFKVVVFFLLKTFFLNSNLSLTITVGITTAYRGLSLTTVSLTSIYILSASEKHEIWSTTAPVKRHQNYFLYFQLLLLENRSHITAKVYSVYQGHNAAELIMQWFVISWIALFCFQTFLPTFKQISDFC